MNALEIDKRKTISTVAQMNPVEILEIGNGVLDAVNSGIVIADATKKSFPIIYVNRAFEEITGYRLEETLGRNCNFLQSDDRHQKEIATIRKALHSGKPCNVVLRNYKKNGSMFWNELAITPVKNKNGALTHFIGIQNDVTQNKKLALLRKAKSEVLEMVVKKSAFTLIAKSIQQIIEQQMPRAKVAILVADTDRKTLSEVNAPNLPKEFINTILQNIPIQPDFCCCAATAFHKKKVIQESIQDEVIWKKHLNIVTKSGLRSCWSYPLVDAERNILGVLTIFHQDSKIPAQVDEELIWELANLASLAVEQVNMRRQLQANLKELSTYSKGLEQKVKKSTADLNRAISELKETNLELTDQTNEAKASKLRAETNEAILLAIIKKFPKGAILLLDAQMRIHFMEGSELMDVQRQVRNSKQIKVSDLTGFSNQRKKLFIDHIERTLNGEYLSFETEYRRVPYAINTTPLSAENGKITHALFVLLNIRSRKQNEKRMLENLEREKELSNLKSRFISTASHEFRTPLSVILSSTTLIEKQNEPGMEAQRVKHLNRIKSNVQHLVTVLNDFLSLSKLEEGETVAKPDWFDLIALGKSMIDQMVLSKKKGQVIAFEHYNPSMHVYLDGKLVRHILLNLLGNAIKYSGEGSKITLKILEDEKKTTIAVIDEGIGIPLKEQQYLFQRFFRAKNSLNIAGTGLGLHIVRQYTELMDGALEFESMENRGSTFTVTFPKKTKENEENTSN